MEHVVSQLIAKKSEMMGEISHILEKAEKLKQAVDAIDISIKVFDPEFDLDSVKEKKHREKFQYFEHGEVSKLSMDILRLNKTPMTVKEITSEMLKLKQYDNINDKLRSDFENNVRAFLMKSKMVQEIDEEGQLKKWKIAKL